MIGKMSNCSEALSQLRQRFESWRKKKKHRIEAVKFGGEDSEADPGKGG